MWVLRSNDPTPVVLRLPPGASRTVGRNPPADFVVDSPLLSRMHCRLSASETKLTVEDLRSTNGTYVNGERVRQAPLQDGDRLRLGRFDLSVSAE
jgi:pSer/pThr/pTyr-binding forkhead associated (FHA) protein